MQRHGDVHGELSWAWDELQRRQRLHLRRQLQRVGRLLGYLGDVLERRGHLRRGAELQWDRHVQRQLSGDGDEL